MNPKGFGLVELVVVVAIIAVIAGGSFYLLHGNSVTPQQGVSDEQAARQAAQLTASATQPEQNSLDQLEPSNTNVTSSGAVATSGVTTTVAATSTITVDEALAGLGSNKYAAGILPLGDDDYTTTGPKKGYVYLCNVMSGGGGAEENGPWIGTSTWNSNDKISVSGKNSWSNASITISVDGGTRTIVTNDLPTIGTTGNFPIESTDPAYQYDSNPNSIEAQNYTFNLPANPTQASAPSCIYGEVGVMTNGVLLLDGFDELYRDAAAHEIQDSCDGHPHEGGVYHYHSLSSCIPDATVTNIIGWAFDGFPITGPEISPGRYLTTSDLDECHGITSPIMENGKLVDMYHYVMTQDFPYSISCFRGKSYEPHPNGSGGGQTQTGSQTQSQTSGQSQGGTPPAPPQAAIEACTGKAQGAACTVGPTTGTCATIGGDFACKPN